MSLKTRKGHAIFKKYGGRCHYCGCAMVFDGEPGSTNQFTIDHKIPRSKGGTNEDSNLAACCEGCNNVKANRTEQEFFEWLDAHDLEAAKTRPNRAARTEIRRKKKEYRKSIMEGASNSRKDKSPAVEYDLGASWRVSLMESARMKNAGE